MGTGRAEDDDVEQARTIACCCKPCKPCCDPPSHFSPIYYARSQIEQLPDFARALPDNLLHVSVHIHLYYIALRDEPINQSTAESLLVGNQARTRVACHSVKTL